MTLLHTHYALRNKQAFQRLLDGSSPSDRGHSAGTVSGGLSNSGGKSWNRGSTLMMTGIPCDINARDRLGRTVLHLACSSIDPSGMDYVRLLLGHPAVDVNLQDVESQWTALHRALYQGNIAAAILLLQRSDTDTSLKDTEGYTAFDLYNSTVEGTKPSEFDKEYTELFTWGTNRNAALGHGDGDDRLYPDQVIVHRKDDTTLEKRNLDSRFLPLHVQHVSMSKLHTAVVTTESDGNLRVCGFGSGGRLGPGQHTQYKLKSLPRFTYTIVLVALGQDHTLALTNSGEVLSWGLNRFHQLGYVVESSSVGRLDEPIQSSPRKLVGVLRKETVQGIAACKMASACWTTKEVFTWGTNNGQLGYDKLAQPIQIFPRIATKVSLPVVAIEISDFALACLLSSRDVLCIWNDRHFKINFPTHAFPSEIRSHYRPPQALKDAHVDRITSCDDTFAALSSNGEVFTFTLPRPTDAPGKERMVVKPQRVWALRKQFSAVKDVALGSDGSIIICTESGHVFVRSRTGGQSHGSSTKPFKFQRIRYLQRVISVCANSTGAYGALRVDWRPRDISVCGNVLGEALKQVQPYLRIGTVDDPSHHTPSPTSIRDDVTATPQIGQDEEGDDLYIQKDIQTILLLIGVLGRDKQSRSGPNSQNLFEAGDLPDGADVMVQTQSGSAFPAHRTILAARCPALHEVLSGTRVILSQSSDISVRLLSHSKRLRSTAIRLGISGCHGFSILILLVYLYTDDLLPLWDRRVTVALDHQLQNLKVNAHQVRRELQTLATMLDLPALAQALDSSTKSCPVPTLVRDMLNLFGEAQSERHPSFSPLAPDVVLQLSDRDVLCHSTVLRARSQFFSDFFNEKAWTANRWDVDGKIRVNLKHLTWQVMQFVLHFLCCGQELDMFEVLDFVHSPDEVLEFMFEILSAANELHLDRLVLLCSIIILRHSNINNACYVLADATHFHSVPLIESIQSYMTINMEALLESQMLDDLTPDLVEQLGGFVRHLQTKKSPISRSNALVNKAMETYADWLALQDIPQPIVRSNRHGPHKSSPIASPPSPSKMISRQPSRLLSPVSGPIGGHPDPRRSIQASDGILTVDDSDTFHTPTLDPLRRPSSDSLAVSAWKGAPTIPRFDMNAIMAEAASGKDSDARSSGVVLRDRGSDARSGDTQQGGYNAPQRERRKMEGLPPVDPVGSSSILSMTRASGSPWRIPNPQTLIKPIDLSIDPSLPASPARTLSTSFSGPQETILYRHVSKPNESPPSKPAGHPSKPPHHQSTQPGLGPIFTPSRQDSSSAGPSSTRRVSGGGKAWTLPPVLPTVDSSSPTPIVSFVAIQQLQQDQGAFRGKDKRSLLEIQEEEQARQAEADFLKWWAAEEERVMLESQRPSQPPRSGSERAAKKHRKPKGKASNSRVSSENRPRHGQLDE